MFKKQYLILSLTLFLIYSCANDNPSNSSPATIVGTWSSGELSYHQAENCLNEGQSLEDFVNTAISSNIEIEAQNTATLACLDESEYETCLADFIELYSNNFDNADSLLFNDLISNTFLYNNMTLIINSGSSYETQYDGSCIDFNIFSQGACDLFDGAEWVEDSEECIFLTENACTEIGSGTWNDGWVGDWEQDGDNYTLYNFNNDSETTKTLVFDGNGLFIVLSTSEDQCLCSASTPLDSSTECVDVDDCIWLESHCISLNFSK